MPKGGRGGMERARVDATAARAGGKGRAARGREGDGLWAGVGGLSGRVLRGCVVFRGSVVGDRDVGVISTPVLLNGGYIYAAFLIDT